MAILFLFAILLSGAPSKPGAGSAIPSGTEVGLSAAETAAINRRIAALHSPVDRSVAAGWSNAKKVAETLCRPAALPVLKSQMPGTDRVFLGINDDPKALRLESSERLTGNGSARTPKGWQDFSFTCNLDAATGKVVGFEAVSSAK